MKEEPEEEQTNDVEPAVSEVEALEEALAKEKERADANLAGWQRAQADFINYKRRVKEEDEEMVKLAEAALVLSLLPILDDWERALTSIPDELANLNWVDGIRLIERKLRALLEAKGLSPIAAVGEPFDPNQHEAAMHGKGQEGIVVGELQKGYKFHGKVIRPAKVVVGNGEEEEKED